MDSMRKPPSLVNLCTKVAIENIRYIGNVGGLDYNLLEQILPHCTVKQLAHIENCTQDTDLSQVTDRLWKKFFERQFGTDSLNMAIERMNKKKISFKWKKLYDAKTIEREEAQRKVVERLKQRYSEANAHKQSKQIKMISKIPPSSKRPFWGGGSSNTTSYKSPIMKKSKMEYLKSPEKFNHATVRRTSVQRTSSSSGSGSSSVPMRPNSSSKMNGASNSRPPFGRR